MQDSYAIERWNNKLRRTEDGDPRMNQVRGAIAKALDPPLRVGLSRLLLQREREPEAHRRRRDLLHVHWLSTQWAQPDRLASRRTPERDRHPRARCLEVRRSEVRLTPDL